jgi:RNA polymerase sigma-70 factor (ECF subfamily)
LVQGRDIRGVVDDQAVAPTESDTLFAAARSGDAEALEARCRQWSGSAVGLATRILGDQARAEAVVEEALLAVWRSSATGDPGALPVHAWFLSLVHQRALDRLRTERPGATAGGEPVAPTSTQGDGRALQALEPDQRQLLEMGYFAGLTRAEIAAATGMPLATVHARITSGIDALAKALDVPTPLASVGPDHTADLESFAKTASVVAGYDQEWEAFEAHMPACPRCGELFVASGLVAAEIATLAGAATVSVDFTERLLAKARGNPPGGAAGTAPPGQPAQAKPPLQPPRRGRLRLPAHWRQLVVVAGIPLAIALVLFLWNLQVQSSLDDQRAAFDRQNTILRSLAPGAHVIKLTGSDDYKNTSVLLVQPNDSSSAVAYIRQLPPASSGRTYFFWYGNPIEWVPAVNFQMPESGALALPLSPVGPGVTRVQITIEAITGPVGNTPGPVILSAALSS